MGTAVVDDAGKPLDPLDAVCLSAQAGTFNLLGPLVGPHVQRLLSDVCFKPADLEDELEDDEEPPAPPTMMLRCSSATIDAHGLAFEGLLAGFLADGSATQVRGRLIDLPETPQRYAERHLILELAIPPALTPARLLAPYSDVPKAVAPFLNGDPQCLPLSSAFTFAGATLQFCSVDLRAARYQDVRVPSDVASAFVAALGPGLQFKIDLVVGPDFIFAFKTIGSPERLGFTAALTRDFRGRPFLRLEENFDRLGFALSGFALHLEKLTLDFELSRLASAAPAVTVTGGMKIGSTPAAFLAHLDLDAQRLDLRLVGSVPLPTLSDLEHLLKLDGIASSYLPPNPGGFGSFTLEALELSFWLEPAGVSRAAFTLSTQQAVELIEGLIEVRPTVDVRLDHPFDEKRRSEHVTLRGEWLFCEARFDTLLDLKEKSLHARLAVGEAVDVSAALSLLVPGVSLPMKSLELIDLELVADWGQKSFSAELDFASQWKLALGGGEFAVESLGLAITFSEKAVQHCQLRGVLELGGLELELQAERVEGVWGVRAATLQALPLSSLLGELTAELALAGLNLGNVPDELKGADVVARNVYLAHAPGRATTFYCALDHAISISSDFVIDSVFLRLDAGSRGLTGSARMRLQLAGVGVVLEASKTEDGWLYAGATGPGQDIPMGRLLEDLAARLGVTSELPEVVRGLTIKDLGVRYHAGTRDFEFHGTCDFVVEGQAVELVVEVKAQRKGGGYVKSVGAHLDLAGLKLFVDFFSTETTRGFIGRYATPTTVEIRKLVGSFAAPLAAGVPEGLAVDLKELCFAWSKDSLGSRCLLCVHLGARTDFSGLPLVGEQARSIAVQDLQLLAVSKPFSKDTVALLNSQLAGGATLPVQDLEQGVHVSAAVTLGDVLQRLSVPVAPQPALLPDDPFRPASLAPPAAVVPRPGKWIRAQKSFGPLAIESVGAEFKDGVLWLLLDSSLALPGLTIGLDGVGMGSKLKPFDPKFRLAGLSLSFEKGPVAISGGFSSAGATDPSKAQYVGEARIETETFGLSAMGSYGTVDGHPSLFIFALLEQPIGGPPSFFVTGIAAGYGYNSRLRRPDVKDLRSFSLIRSVMGDPEAPQHAGVPLASDLTGDVLPSHGDQWLAAGVRFTSFEMVESFALLAARLTGRFELRLLGLSRLSVPAGSPNPVAYAELALQADFCPDDGLLAIEGFLNPSSYFFSRDCHLTGGFAFSSWFSGANAGDFVLTMGGYHPSFVRPSEYPTVPRLGMNWQVSPNLTVKGVEYFALVPSGVMAGVAMQALWQAGDLRAWFNAAADFWIQWRPFHYEASVQVQLGASYRLDLLFTSVTISVQVGAELKIWGPPFAGEAKVDLGVVRFTVSFGAGAAAVAPLPWSEVKTHLLPPAGRVRVSVSRGLVKELEAESGFRWVINGEDFELVTTSVVPAHSALLNGAGAGAGCQSLGISPMGIGLGDEFASTHTVTLLRRGLGETYDELPSNLATEPVLANVPRALWGDQRAGPGEAERTVKGALVGLRIAAKTSEPKGAREVALEPLLYQHDDARTPLVISRPPVPPEKDYGRTFDVQDPQAFAAVVRDDAAAAARARLLAAMADNGLDVPRAFELASVGDALQDWPELRPLGS